MKLILRKIKLYEHQAHLLALVLSGVTLLIGGMWISDPQGNYEPVVFTLGTFSGILFALPKLAERYVLPKLTFDNPAIVEALSFFEGITLTNLSEAKKLSKSRNVPIFMVIYDPHHPKQSKLNYSLGYFSEYDITKRLINENFIQVIAESTGTGVSDYVPADDPLENCRLVVISAANELIASEGVYANPDEGLKKVRDYIDEIES